MESSLKGLVVDVIDSTLLQALRADGRASWAELGRLVGLSGPSVQERVRRLEDRGVITGYAAVVAPAAVGLGVSALIGLVQSDEALSEDVVAQLASIFNLGKWSCFAVAVPATVVGLVALAVVTLRGRRPAST